MLNPPLSLLSNELLAFIVEHLAALPYSPKAIRSLSLADRAFTPFCQSVTFRTLQLGSNSVTNNKVPYQLEKYQAILNEKPSAADQVRFLRFALLQERNEWIFNHPAFIRILQLLEKSPSAPHNLEFGGSSSFSMSIENPIHFVDILANSFFSQSLRTLHLVGCTNVPLPLLTICPRLQELHLESVGATDDSYSGYQDYQCAREAPSPQVFDYRYSDGLIRQMITPPPRFQAPLAFWSKLRILEACPYVEEDMECLQPILDAACNSLEELHLTRHCSFAEQIPLAGLVNLTNLSNLHVFSLVALIEGNAEKSSVLQDINTVLSRIPSSNNIENLFFEFTVSGQLPFSACLDEDWAGLSQQIIRIAADKPLELDFQMMADNNDLEDVDGDVLLYSDVMQKVDSLSDCPNICIHFWNTTLQKHGYRALPAGEVRTKCMQ